jgi:hypothetical protein
VTEARADTIGYRPPWVVVRKFFRGRTSYLYMSKTYAIYSGKRVVSVQESATPLQAAVDYVRSLGTPDAEITRLGVDSVSWRGARFIASLAPPAQQDSK